MIAIHDRPGSFSDKWIEYCEQKDILYKTVNCFESDIIEQMKDISGLMWHWAHYDYRAVLFARQLTYSLEMMGKHVFPNSKTCWHFDDKVGQKYLLEAIGAPLVQSYVFYDKNNAMAWAKTAEYPKVFKLRSGAGAQNVKIVKNYIHAKHLIDIAFSKGFNSRNRLYYFKERIWKFRRDKSFRTFFNISKGIGRLLIPTAAEIHLPIERDYIYFQNYIPGNNHDIRIMVIGGKAFGFKRMVRQGDFRASGSGKSYFSKNIIPVNMLYIAQKLSKTLLLDSVAIDFISSGNKPLIVEISYAFGNKAFPQWPGYWNENLEWIDRITTPEYCMIEDFLKSSEKNATL